MLFLMGDFHVEDDSKASAVRKPVHGRLRFSPSRRHIRPLGYALYFAQFDFLGP